MYLSIKIARLSLNLSRLYIYRSSFRTAVLQPWCRSQQVPFEWRTYVVESASRCTVLYTATGEVDPRRFEAMLSRTELISSTLSTLLLWVQMAFTP